MNELYELKGLRDKLKEELTKYKSKELSKETLTIVKELSSSIDKLNRIIEKCEEDEDDRSYMSYNSYGDMYEGSYRGNGNRSNRGSYNNGNSYARGRGRNARRDNMGRYSNEGYSRNNDNVAQLREMMMEEPNDEIKREYERVISRLEQM